MKDFLAAILAIFRKPVAKPVDDAPPPWVTELRAVLGLHELRDNAKLSAWLRSDGKTLGNPGKLPWCGDAVDTAIARALPSEPRPGALGKNPYWARNWRLLGKDTSPCLGAVLVFSRDGGGHVGFAVGHDATHFHVLGGNQGDTVSVVRIAKSRLLAARWPATATVPKLPLPRMSTNAAGVSTNEA
jgi:uncharacterized protein (TIGR02594 family)